MVWQIQGVALWAWSHLLKRVSPGCRASLGEGRAKALVTVAAFAAIGLMIHGYRPAETVQLWDPPAFLRHVNNLLMVVAVLLVNLGFSRGALRPLTRHPILAAVMFWAATAVFAGAQASPQHWVLVGRACQRYARRAMALGMKVAFLNQPVEVPGQRLDLAARVGLQGRRPDIVMRFGCGPALRYAACRPVGSVMV